ncbi:hypothetical protein FQR65_LT10642 [Abscondita terminalis]|nr:hypothetical protein FQR65_LT10642 [Abscondita terminalis]
MNHISYSANGKHQSNNQSGKKLLQIGARIDIRRTDGRVHSAYIAAINYPAMCVSVEWYENGEIKGKEIDLPSLQTLNPQVLLSPPDNENQDDNCVQVGMIETHAVSRTHGNDINNVLTANSIVRTAKIPSHRATLKIANSEPESVSAMELVHVRTSSVVKKVEKMKKSREERRQKHAEDKIDRISNFGGPENPHQALARMIAEYRHGLIMKPLTDQDVIENHLITVCVRKRPLNKSEISRHEVDVITIPSTNQLIVHEPKNKIDLRKYMDNQIFRFDYAFDESCNNELVYKYTAQPLIKAIFQGGFATCFAYGQTGSGKTHTMGGNFVGRNQDSQQGIYGMATKDVFNFVRSEKYLSLKLVISASFFEIYSGKVFDLLANKTKLRVLEDGKQQVQIVGLTEKVVESPEEVLKLITRGNMARTFGQTAANAYSSRSHAIFQIILRSSGSKHKVHGKLSLIDLAGNERGADTASTDRQTRMEGAEINKSLLALKECIRALGRKKAHLPFRMSKLTQVLKDSFVGPNSRTCMIAMVSPGVSSCEHSLNTLRYANRVKELVAVDVQSNNVDEDSENLTPNDDTVLQHQLDDHEMSEDMINFHHIVSELQLVEDKMVENHKSVVKQMSTVYEKARSLLQMADVVDFNQDEYCTSWDTLLTNTINTLAKSKAIVLDFKAKLADEEKLSRKTKNN